MIHRIPCFQGAAEKEHSSSLAIAFLLFTLILTIFMIHAMLQVCSALTTSSCQHCDAFGLRSSSIICRRASPLSSLVPSLASLWPRFQRLRQKGSVSLHSLGVDFFSSIGFFTRILGWGVFPHHVLPHSPAPNHIWVGIQSPQGQFLSGKRFDIIFPCSLRFNYCHIFCRTSGVSWYLQFLELPYPLLWLEAASIYSALLTLSTRSHLFRALPLAHSSVLLIL